MSRRMLYLSVIALFALALALLFTTRSEGGGSADGTEPATAGVRLRGTVVPAATDQRPADAAPSDTFQGIITSSEGVADESKNDLGRMPAQVGTSSDTFQGKPAEWWAHRATKWKRGYQRVVKTSRQRWTPTLMHGIDLAAVAYGQSPSELRRVAYCESKFYLYARSPGGHLGPFQFHPTTWRSLPYGRFSPFDPIAAPLNAAAAWARGRKSEWSCA